MEVNTDSFSYVCRITYIYASFTNSLTCIPQGKRGVWIKLPIELASLVQPTVEVTITSLHYAAMLMTSQTL